MREGKNSYRLVGGDEAKDDPQVTTVNLSETNSIQIKNLAKKRYEEMIYSRTFQVQKKKRNENFQEN